MCENRNLFENHEENLNSPGFLWKPKNAPLIESHKVSINELARIRPLHVRLMAAYAERLIMDIPLSCDIKKNSSVSIWANLYDKFQFKRTSRESKRKDFDNLIMNILDRGFDQSYPIPIDSNYRILDGAHRFATCLATGIDPYVQIYDAPSHDIKESWFIDHGFSQDEVKIIRESNVGWRSLTKVSLIWASALPFWEEILDRIPRNSRIVRSFHCETGGNFDDIVRTSYMLDGMPAYRLDKKIIDLRERGGTKIGVIVCSMTGDEAATFKKVVRGRLKSKVNNYFFDSIMHIIDDPQAADEVISMLNRSLSPSLKGH